LNNQLLNTNPILAEAFKNFFDNADIAEFIRRNQPLISEAESGDKEKVKSKSDFEIKSSPQTRTQVDILITFAETKFTAERFLEFLIYLGQLTITSGEYATALDIFEKIVNTTKDSPALMNITANAHLSIGEIYSRQAQWNLSFSSLDNAKENFAAENDLKGNVNCENLFGTIYGDQGNTEKAKEHFENALVLLENFENPALLGKVEINLGIINTIQGDFNEALSYLKRALLNFEKIGDLKRISEIRQNLGMIFLKKKEFSAALDQFDLSIDAAARANYLQTLGIAYVSKANVFTLLKDYKLADAFAAKAMEIAYKINDKLSIAEVYKVTGVVKRNLGELDTAQDYLLTSLRLNKDLNNQLNIAETKVELGHLMKLLNEEDKCKQYFIDALDYYRKIKSPVDIAELEKLIKN
jgi:tetratricopeptide (TPR) repeat protein